MWEDDYCQVEVISASNYDLVKRQTIEAIDFGNAHFNGIGFTALYQRENIPYPISQLLIPIENFEAILAENSFIRIDKIYYQYEGLVNHAEDVTRAYGDDDFSIWAEVKERILTNIWITSRGANTDDRIIKATSILNTMGEKYQLILVDWNSCEVIDLKEINEVKAYLKERY
jgi:hypothetical protein